MSAGCCALLMLLLLAGRAPLRALAKPKPGATAGLAEAAQAQPPRPLRVVFSQPRCAACTFVAAVSYAVMVFLMAGVPLAMADRGFSFAESSTVVQVHMLTMFAPSFVTGHVVRRLGVPVMQIAGALLIGLAAGLALLTDSLAGFAASQGIVGAGWNLCFVSATAGLQQQTHPSERLAAQSLNDMVVFSLSGIGSLVAAFTLRGVGWRGVAVG